MKTHAFALLSLLLASPVLPASDPSLAGAATAIDRPEVAGTVRPGPALRVGRAEITPAPGTPVRLLRATGAPCGLWVDGAAHLRYLVEDRFSAPVARRNLRRTSAISPVEAGDGLAFTRDLEGAVVWSWELAAAAAAAGVEGDPAARSWPDWAASFTERALFSPPSHELLAARREGVTGAFVALFHDRDGDLLLAGDPLQERLEVLWRLEALDRDAGGLAGRLHGYELAAQPLGRAWWERFPDALVAVDQRLAVSHEDGAHVTVTAHTRLRATRDGVTTWKARLLPWTRDRNGGVHPVAVAAVESGGHPLDWTFDRGSLLVALPRPLAAGQEIEVRTATAGERALLVNNDDYWLLGLGGWYPAGGLNAELATYELTVRVPERWPAFASGTTVSARHGDGQSELVSRLDRPMQAPVVVVGNFHELTEESEGVRVRVASYARTKERESRLLSRNFLAARQFYERLFGLPYPFAELDIVEINDWGFGVAPPGMIFITREAFSSLGMLRAEGGEEYTREVNQRFVHEIAHGWWGHVAKQDAAEEGWINEAFAEYSAALCLQAMRGGGKAGERELRNAVVKWKGYAKDAGRDASLYLASHLAGKDDRDGTDRWILLYQKGPLVVHALRQELARRAGGEEAGDRFFFALLRSYLKNAAGRFGSTAMLVGILDQLTGTSWQPWFERYVYGTETPEVG